MIETNQEMVVWIVGVVVSGAIILRIIEFVLSKIDIVIKEQ